jgi:hypothetical protein
MTPIVMGIIITAVMNIDDVDDGNEGFIVHYFWKLYGGTPTYGGVYPR